MTPAEKPIDALRISSRECEQILQSLEQGTRSVDGNRNQRGENDRVEIGNDLVAVVRPMSQEGRAARFIVRGRNISATGLGFLHGQFLYKNTSCEIILINREQQGFKLRGRVVRCRFVEKNVHEIGIRFDQAVDIQPILGHAA